MVLKQTCIDDSYKTIYSQTHLQHWFMQHLIYSIKYYVISVNS